MKRLKLRQPKNVIALAYNYKDLVGPKKKFDEPLIFFKSPRGVILSGQPIRIPQGIDTVWVEVELAFVIKKRARHVPVSRARDYILGYTIANDVTAENIHGRDWHLARSKGLETFCPVGPFLATDLDTRDLALSTRINERITQKSTTANRILNDSQALSLITRFFTLEPGDLVLTGTPAGARQSLVKPGDEVRMTIEGLGELSSSIQRERIKK
ncbi:MAG: fumarylacetoacetate hydrolase family protein [Candidatus Omnitrophica bacterium]|nr:fumarylacetoacetate hydrolase family protein [Candidatus Omnitrophota bacterium]